MVPSAASSLLAVLILGAALRGGGSDRRGVSLGDGRSLETEDGGEAGAARANASEDALGAGLEVLLAAEAASFPSCTYTKACANTPESFVCPSHDDYVEANRQATEESNFWAQMASIANRVNNFGTPVAGWNLKMNYDLGGEKDVSSGESCKYHQHVAIYTKQEEVSSTTCVLTFSSMAYASDVYHNRQTSTEPLCGFPDVHRGYVWRMRTFLGSGKFQEFNEFLAKCSVVIAAGHSQGGALANLITGCANNRDNSDSSNFLFRVNYLYTFGTPGVTQGQQLRQRKVTNDQDDKAFNGARFYVHDGNGDDPIACISNLKSFLHPAIKAVTLETPKGENGETVIMHEHDWNMGAPEADDFSSKPEYAWSTCHLTQMGSKHTASVYIQRLLTIQGLPTNLDPLKENAKGSET